MERVIRLLAIVVLPKLFIRSSTPLTVCVFTRVVLIFHLIDNAFVLALAKVNPEFFLAALRTFHDNLVAGAIKVLLYLVSVLDLFTLWTRHTFFWAVFIDVFLKICQAVLFGL